MKKLPDRNYAALTGTERAAVAFAAMARDDDAELRRLKDTCPLKGYRITDPDYSDRIDALLTLTLATECDLRGWAIVATSCAATTDRDPAPVIRHMLAIDAALDRFAAEQGIDPADLRRAGSPRHALVAHWLDEPAPQPDEAHIERELQGLRDYWRTRVEERGAA